MLNPASSEMKTAEQIKTEKVSPLKETYLKNELACTPNIDVSQLQYNERPGGYKSSASSLPVPSGQSFSSNVVKKPLSTSGEYMKSIYNSPPVMVDHGRNMKPSLESSNNSHSLMASNTNATLCHSYKDKIHTTSEANASVVTEKYTCQAHAIPSQPFVRTVSGLPSVFVEASTVFVSKALVDHSPVKKTYGAFSSGSANLGHPNFGDQQPKDGCLQRKSEFLSGLEAEGHSTGLAQPALEIYNRNAQKGPRIANVVHRFKSSVELLEIGVVLSGRFWSSSQAIFLKGLSLGN